MSLGVRASQTCESVAGALGSPLEQVLSLSNLRQESDCRKWTASSLLLRLGDVTVAVGVARLIKVHYMPGSNV